MTAPALVFYGEDDPGGRRYELDGVVIPSVTTILGWGIDKSRIPPWTGAFGHLVHKACELDSLGLLDESTLVAQEIDGRWCVPWPRLRAWRRYTKGDRPYAVERPVWCEIDGLRYAGTIDVVWCPGRDGLFAIDDIKTGKQARPSEHGPQVQAYARAWEQRMGGQVKEAACVYLRDDGPKRVRYDEPKHLETFRAALGRWYEANG